MRFPFLLALGLSLALHALIFLALPAPPPALAKPPARPLELRLSRAESPPRSGPPPTGAVAPTAVPAPVAPKAPAAAEPAAAPPAAPPPAAPPAAGDASLGPSSAPERKEKGEEASASEPSGEAEGLPGVVEESPGLGAGPPGLDPALALRAELETFVEARKIYPEAARRRGSEGVVRIAVVVAPDGSLRALRRALSSGSSLLDQAALELLRAAFPLGTKPGRELEIVLAIRYKLKP